MTKEDFKNFKVLLHKRVQELLINDITKQTINAEIITKSHLSISTHNSIKYIQELTVAACANVVMSPLITNSKEINTLVSYFNNQFATYIKLFDETYLRVLTHTIFDASLLPIGDFIMGCKCLPAELMQNKFTKEYARELFINYNNSYWCNLDATEFFKKYEIPKASVPDSQENICSNYSQYMVDNQSSLDINKKITEMTHPIVATLMNIGTILICHLVYKYGVKDTKTYIDNHHDDIINIYNNWIERNKYFIRVKEMTTISLLDIYNTKKDHYIYTYNIQCVQDKEKILTNEYNNPISIHTYSYDKENKNRFHIESKNITKEKIDKAFDLESYETNLPMSHYYGDKDNNKYLPNILVLGLSKLANNYYFPATTANNIIMINLGSLSDYDTNELNKQLILINNIRNNLVAYKNILNDQEFMSFHNALCTGNIFIANKLNNLATNRYNVEDGCAISISNNIKPNNIPIIMPIYKANCIKTKMGLLENPIQYCNLQTLQSKTENIIASITSYLSLCENIINKQLETKLKLVYVVVNYPVQSETDKVLQKEIIAQYHLVSETFRTNIGVQNIDETTINEIADSCIKHLKQIYTDKTATINNQIINMTTKEIEVYNTHINNILYPNMTERKNIKSMNAYPVACDYSIIDEDASIIAYLTHYLILTNKYSQFFMDKNLLRTMGLLSNVLIQKYEYDSDTKITTIKDSIIEDQIPSCFTYSFYIERFDYSDDKTNSYRNHERVFDGAGIPEAIPTTKAMIAYYANHKRIACSPHIDPRGR